MIHSDCIFETGNKLYTDGNYALEYARNIPQSNPNWNYKTQLHYLWRDPLPFGRKQALAIKSALVSQNLSLVEINLWSNINLSDNEYLQELLPYINLLRYDPEALAVGTCLEGLPLLNITDKLCWLDGDLARLLLLYNFGGVWVDMDMLLLRDLSPLLPYEFMYQWGTELDKINGAIMRMYAMSDLARHCISEILRRPAGACSTDWGSDLYGQVRTYNKNWIVFPCAFFNTEWQLYVNMGESGHPFRSTSGEVPLYEGAFAWHWHNKWEAEIEPGCKFEKYEKIINDKFSQIFTHPEYVIDIKNKHLGGNIAGGDPATFVPETWEWLINRYNIKTVLDIGCGQGHAVQWFREAGLKATGIDGLPENIQKAPAGCTVCDLTKNKIVNSNPDLVWCCEVVEHIEECYIDNLIDSLCNGRIIAMTFAEPGQAGHHHVNCQNADYWIQKIISRGYKYRHIDSMVARNNSHGWPAKSLLIFMRCN